MKRFLWLLIVAAVVAGTVLGGPTLPAQAARKDHSVFVQTNNSNGNSIVRYADAGRNVSDGRQGGRADGAASDPLASQSSLVFDSADGLLFAVNAGSNTVSVFSVNGDQLHLNQVISSGGSFPVGFALRGSLLYVLNARLAGNASGFERKTWYGTRR
jgi:DNA-binding beta-propeller fold protein YncE